MMTFTPLSVWSIMISHARNGYVVSFESETSTDESPQQECMVFEDTDDAIDSLDCMANLLRYVAEHFGATYSKHNRRNLRVTIEERPEE